GQRVVSADAFGNVKVWHTVSGLELRTLHVSGIAYKLAFSPEGAWLAAGTNGNQLVLWDVRPLTDDVWVERAALGLVECLFARPLLKREVLEQIRGHKA